MFRRIALRGQQGTIAWNYRTVVTLGPWTLHREPNAKDGTLPRVFDLRATIVGPVDGFSLRQVPLLFTAPRGGRNAGLFCFPVQQVRVSESTLIATLGPPEY